MNSDLCMCVCIFFAAFIYYCLFIYLSIHLHGEGIRDPGLLLLYSLLLKQGTFLETCTIYDSDFNTYTLSSNGFLILIEISDCDP